MAGTHTEAALNELNKPDLVQIVLNTQSNLGSQIAKLTTEVKEADVAIFRNANSKLLERVVATERQF